MNTVPHDLTGSEVVGKKLKWSVTVLFIVGFLLIAVSIVCFIASLLNEFDFEFLLTCITTGVAGGSAIVIGFNQRSKPDDLIIATSDSLILVQENITINYNDIVSLRSKYSERELFIMTASGIYSVSLVAALKETKARIAQKIKEVTGHDIVVA